MNQTVAFTDRAAFLNHMHDLGCFVFLLNSLPSFEAPALALSPETSPGDDLPLVERIVHAYQRANASYSASDDGFWDIFTHSIKKEIHDALVSGDIPCTAAFLRDPSSNALFWGFDAITCLPRTYASHERLRISEYEPHKSVLSRQNSKIDWKELYARWIYDAIFTFAVLLGARKLLSPELAIERLLDQLTQPIEIDSLIDLIEQKIGVSLSFPNPFKNELGIPSKRGIIGMRTIQALFQAWRIAGLAEGRSHFKVLEIGAGLGRTAYFARALGITAYSIIDIPLTNVAQSYFLGRTLGQEQIHLAGEASESKEGVKIIPASQLSGLEEQYDLIVNIDSMTEMPKAVAESYRDFIKMHTKKFLSINLERNAFTVQELFSGERCVKKYARSFYPMRRGYIEELIDFA